MFDKLLEFIYDGVYIVDSSRKIVYWNKAAERITGFKAEDVVGRNCHDNILNHIDDQGRLLCLNGCPLHNTIKDRISRETYIFLQHKEGYRIPVIIKTVPLEDEGEYSVAEVFTLNNDVASTLPSFACDFPMVTVDTLSGLSNRAYLDQYLAHQINLERTLEVKFGVIIIDIDTFEEINNIFGRKLSDDVMKILAKTFRNIFKGADAIGRWRQDEFLFVYKGISKDQLKNISEEIRMLSEGSALRGATFKDIDVTVSVGATLYRSGEGIDGLMERAYQCLKNSKRRGGNFVTLK